MERFKAQVLGLGLKTNLRNLIYLDGLGKLQTDQLKYLLKDVEEAGYRSLNSWRIEIAGMLIILHSGSKSKCRKVLQKIKEFFGENHTVIMNVDKKAYLSALAISENIIVTCDSSSMISEAALTGKPIYIANILPRKNDIRFQKFRNLFRELNITRNLGEDVENWNYQKLDETNRVAKIIKERISN